MVSGPVGELTDFDELIMQDTFINLEQSQQVDEKYNLSALLTNLTLCQDNVPTINVTEKNLGVATHIMEQMFILGGCIRVAVRVQKSTAETKYIEGLSNTLHLLGNKTTTHLLNVFHFLFMQTQELKHSREIIGLLTSPKSLLRKCGINQVSSEGYTPVEYAFLNNHFALLELIPNFELKATPNLIQIIADLQLKSTQKFEDILNEQLPLILSKQSELNQFTLVLKNNILLDSKVSHDKELCGKLDSLMGYRLKKVSKETE